MKGFISQVFSYLGSSLVVQVTGLISLILLMQNLSIEEFGLYSFITEFVGIFLFIADGGLTIYLIKEISKDRNNYKKKYEIAQTFQYIISVILFLIILLVNYALNDDKYYYHILIYSFGIVLISIFNPITGLWIGLNKTKLIVLKDISISTIKLIYIYIGITLFFGVYYYLFSGIVVGILWLLIIIYINKKYKHNYFNINKNLNEINKNFIAGIPFIIILITNAIYNKIDIIMIEKLLGLDAVSFYNAASKFVYPFGFISTALMNSIFPRMVTAFQIRNNKNKILFFSVFLLSTLGFLIAFTLLFSGNYIFQFLFNIKYLDAIPIFNILIFFIPIAFTICALGNFLIAAGKLWQIILINIFMIFLNIFLNWNFIPIYGIIAAAYSTLFCELLVLLASFLLVVKILIKNKI